MLIVALTYSVYNLMCEKQENLVIGNNCQTFSPFLSITSIQNCYIHCSINTEISSIKNLYFSFYKKLALYQKRHQKNKKQQTICFTWHYYQFNEYKIIVNSLYSLVTFGNQGVRFVFT